LKNKKERKTRNKKLKLSEKTKNQKLNIKNSRKTELAGFFSFFFLFPFSFFLFHSFSL